LSELTQEGRTSQDDRPLNDQEYQLLQRLLSDPFSLPIAFKTWLVSYLETSDLNLPIGSVTGLKDILGIASVGGGTLGIFPPGIILPYAGTAAPDGALLCQGQAVSRTTYDRLYALIANTYGAGDGSTTFNVPDLQGRIPVGKGSGAGTTALGANEGLALASRRPHHRHTVTDSHVHIQPNDEQFMVLYGSGGSGFGVVSGGRVAQLEGGSGPAGGGAIVVGPVAAVANDTPAYLTVNFIIIY